MIRFDGKLQILDGNGVEILSIQPTARSTAIPNNISMPKDSETGYLQLSKQFLSKRNPFIIGKSTLDGESTFSSGESFYMSKPSTESTTNNRAFLITANTNIKSLYILFNSHDKTDYPSSIEVWTPSAASSSNNNIRYDIDNYIYKVNIPNNTTSVEIIIPNVNRIESIFVEQDFIINKSTLKSIDRNLMSSTAFTEISFGLISNTSSIVLQDVDQLLQNYIEAGFIEDDLPIEIYLINTLTNKKEAVLKQTASDWSYDTENFTISATASDNLEELQNYDLTYSDIRAGTSLYNTLETFLSSTPYADNHIYENGADTFLKTISSSQDYVYAGTAWDMINQLLLSANMVGFINENGALVIRKVI